MSLLRLGVLASGRGSNLQAIMDACGDGRIPATVAVVISDNNGAYALERARSAGIPAVYIGPSYHSSRAAYEERILLELREYGVELVCLAGYMRIVGPVLLSAYANKIINIHPALLPAFPGLHAQQQAWEYGVRYSGCTVHFVDEGMDTGPIIMQAVVPVLPGDTVEDLAARILEKEHIIYPEAIGLYARGRLSVAGRKVSIKEG